jgi:DNA-binding GntR family transcriptional regulator
MPDNLGATDYARCQWEGIMTTRVQTSIIKRQTVTGSVAEELRRRIVSGVYAGGDQIRQEAVGAELGVSRIPIREALLQLESEGLIVIHTHKGAVVASLTTDDAVDLFEARLTLEPTMLKKAVVAATPIDVTRIGACLAEYERAVKNGADPETLSRLNWAFHTAMCQPADRPRMMTILLSLYTATDRYLRLQINPPEARVKALEDHRVIFNAYQRRQAAFAGKLIKAHIQGAYDDVMKCLRPR